MENETVSEAEDKGPLRGKLLSASEVSDWGNERRIVEPGAKTEDGRTVGGTAVEPPPEDDLNTVDKSIDAVTSTEEETPEPIITIDDPGEFTPQDYSFEVTVYDEEGKNGRTVKIGSPDAWDELLEKDPNLGSAAALAKGLRLAAKMESNIDRDRDEYTRQKAEFDRQTQSQAAQTQALNTMSAEIDYLAENGDLPRVDPKYVDANWSDPEIAKQPGIKERVELLVFMRNENNRRQRLGLKPMTSVLDAFNAFERADNRTKEISARKLAGQQRKEAGAIVAPASPSSQTVAPTGIKVGRGGNLRDLSVNSW